MASKKSYPLIKIYLTGSENKGWALDTDYRLAKQALSSFAQLTTDISECDFVHTVWPNHTFRKLSKIKKPFVCCFPGNPDRLFQTSPGFYAFAKSHYCVAQSREAEAILKKYGLPKVAQIPYIADLASYFPLQKGKAELVQWREKYRIPVNKYIIGNFMRDSLGSDLTMPKPEKGPDIFLEIMLETIKCLGKDRIHVLLAGPRRHWIRRKLREHGIPFTYVGKETEGDDFPGNILSSKELCRLIQICNLIVIPSRSEGGPRAIMEAAACRVPILSTPVGIARDILDPACLYNKANEAAAAIVKDVHSHYLTAYVPGHENRVRTNHSIEAVSRLWKQFYQNHLKV